MTPRVLLDVDGVLAAFVDGFLRLVNERIGTTYASADVTCFDIAEALGWDADFKRSAYDLIATVPDFAARLEVFPGAVEGVRRLRELAEVYVVTSPWHSHPTWEYDRKRWLRRHFDIPFDQVIPTSAKHVCGGDVLIDDKTSTLVRWAEAHPCGIAVQWATLQNRRDGWTGRSAASWGELNALVEEIGGGLSSAAGGAVML